MFRLILFIFLIIPFTSYCQCNLNTYVQGNVIPGTDSLLCHGYTTQINVNNLSGISPFICKLEDKLSSQIIQVDTVNSVFNIFNNIQSGNYSITVIDALGNICNDSIIIYQPDSLYSFIDIIAQSYCTVDGQINVDVFGGTQPYSVQLSNNINFPFNNLNSGFYSLQIQDYNNCFFNIDSIIVPLTPLLQVTLDTDSLHLDIIGGEEPIGVIWPNGETGPNLQANLCPGNYQVLIDDISHCPPIIIDFSIDSIEAIVDPGLSGIVEVNGGNPPYSYLWNTGSTDSVINGLCEGYYQITIFDNENCSVDYSFFLDTIIQAVIDPNLSGVSNVIGGTPPYSYLWSNGSTDSVISGLCEGYYQITITDAANCNNTFSFNIDTLSANLDIENLILEDIVGGSPPYSFEWFTNGISLEINTPQISGLCSGYHEVQVMDFQGCSKFYGFEILPLESGLIYDDIDCETSGFSGTFNVNPSGGTPPYNIFWNDSVTELINIQPGSNYLFIEDFNGCLLKDSVLVDELKEECIYNVISPNNDGINDVWFIDPAFLYENSTITIYNRWGKKIFNSTGYLEPFSGKSKQGKILQQGVYFYSIKLKETTKPLRGTLTIY